jgi:zinc transport system ATP-binding protein
MTRPVIEITHLSFSYSDNPVLIDATFSIGEKEFVAVIGPNGGGKTTLIKLMLGLLTPDSGEIRIFNKPPKTVAHRIGYVPQDVAINKSFPISVIDVVLMGRLRRHPWSGLSKKDKIAAKNALDCLEMLEFQNYKIDDLSGGQRERVFIARALATDPDILILDEPTANIDSHGKSHLYALLKDLNKTKTIIVVSHDTMVLSSYVTSVACINRNVHYHDDSEITGEMLDMGYQCPVELIAHGIPHRILKTHEDK